MAEEQDLIIQAKESTFWELLIDYGADQILHRTEGQIVWLQGDHLPGETDLEEEGHSVEGAAGARDTVIPIGEPDTEWHRRAG